MTPQEESRIVAQRIVQDAARIDERAELTNGEFGYTGVILPESFITPVTWESWLEVRHGILYGRKLEAPIQRFSATVHEGASMFREGVKHALIRRGLFTQEVFERLYATERH